MTEKEKELIHRAAMDIETGNYLILPRSYSEMAMIDKVFATLETPEEERSEKMKEIYEEYRLCTDYDYWKKKNGEQRH